MALFIEISHHNPMTISCFSQTTGYTEYSLVHTKLFPFHRVLILDLCSLSSTMKSYLVGMLYHWPMVEDCSVLKKLAIGINAILYNVILRFLFLDLLSEYRIQQGAILCVTSSYSTWIFCRGVSGFATDCPCVVWCCGLTTCLLHVGPPFGNQFLNNSWAVGLT